MGNHEDFLKNIERKTKKPVILFTTPYQGGKQLTLEIMLKKHIHVSAKQHVHMPLKGVTQTSFIC